MSENFNEILQNKAVRRAMLLEGFKNRQAKQVLTYLNKDILPDLIEQLNARLAKIEKFGFDRGKETTKRLEAMIDELAATTGRFVEIQTITNPELKELAKQEHDWQIGTINNEAGITVGLTKVPTPQLIAAVFAKPFDGRTLKEWYEKLSESAQSRLSQEIRRGVTEGLTTPQIVRRIQNDGYLTTTRAQTEAVARTGVSHIANAARETLYEANEDVLNGVQWISVLDSRSCPTCQSLDGRVFKLKEGPRPPAHVSCRCSCSPVTKSFKEIGLNVKDLPVSTRASMNGQVAGDLTYNDWLKKQSIEIQDQALGKTRAELFRKGGLDVKQFVNQNRVQYTLDELKKREAAAFRKAGL